MSYSAKSTKPAEKPKVEPAEKPKVKPAEKPGNIDKFVGVKKGT
jgi:hypothetical protein